MACHLLITVTRHLYVLRRRSLCRLSSSSQRGPPPRAAQRSNSLRRNIRLYFLVLRVTSQTWNGTRNGLSIAHYLRPRKMTTKMTTPPSFLNGHPSSLRL